MLPAVARYGHGRKYRKRLEVISKNQKTLWFNDHFSCILLPKNM
ncbi:hypothetical protein [Oscillospiraceae bacterium]|nr:hypothetical protein [Oscillospiraceae bacterium]